MSGNNSIPQNGFNSQSPAQPAQQSQQDNLIPWLQDKISLYESEVTRLESELTAACAILRGHQLWLAEVQRREVRQ